jgi:hypothetical protein
MAAALGTVTFPSYDGRLDNMGGITWGPGFPTA